MVSRCSLVAFVLLFVMGCAPVSVSGTFVPVESTLPPASASDTPAPPTDSPPIEGISPEQIRNAQYQLSFTDVPQTVQLTNGVYEVGTSGSADYVNVRVSDFIALGDINGDGINEAAAIISENYGGTGVFTFLVLYSDQGGEPLYVTSAFIDDRPLIESIQVENNEIFLNVTTHDADDPFCCPTLRNNRHYQLINNQLQLTDYTTFTPDGRPRTITIESPAHGAEAFSSVQIKGSVAIAPFENNLAYRIYDVGGVELSAGAFQVNAANPGDPGTFDAMISLGNILSGAVIRIEVQDISAEDGSLLAMDSVELVVK